MRSTSSVEKAQPECPQCRKVGMNSGRSRLERNTQSRLKGKTTFPAKDQE